MRRKNIRLIVALMAFALLGVMAMQFYFLKESFRQKSQLFDLSVNNSLSEVTDQLSRKDAMLFARRRAMAEEEQRKESIKQQERDKAGRQAEQFAMRIKSLNEQIEQDFKRRDSNLRRQFPRIITIDNDFYETYFRDPKELSKVRLQVRLHESIDNYGQVFQNEVHELYVENPGKLGLKKRRNRQLDTIYYLAEDPVYGLRVVSLPRKSKLLQQQLFKARQEQEAERLRKEEQMREVKKMNHFFSAGSSSAQRKTIFEDLANDYEQYNTPLLSRVNPNTLDTLLRAAFKSRGIDLPFTYSISLEGKDSLLFATNQHQSYPQDHMYTTILFPKDIIDNKGILSVNFPDKDKYMMKNMNAVLASSAGLLLLMIGCFAYTIFAIFKQKKISEMKTDFINNMTHEFKTPVSTIMIASEALKDPEITQDQSRVNRLAGVIYDENARLGSHIERVLNVARLDKGELRLEFRQVDINDLLAAIVDSMDLQFVKRGAKVTTRFNASDAVVNGDELHLSNVFFNLIDNALKYSQDTPEIEISTFTTSRNLHVRVADKGMGMSKDQLLKIFDQFYRIPTGNIHDVKGFGLGLSYVHDIVKKHKGNVKVKSEKDKGSEFEIIVPLTS